MSQQQSQERKSSQAKPQQETKLSAKGQPKQQSQKRPSTQKERERQHEARKAAQRSLELQNKAKELINAAAGAGDPEERQKLLQQALDKEIEAETFGKTARYLNTGAFQGLCAGAGLGGGVGVALGTLTGTLVGGTTGTVTGGLGGGLGLAVGAAHGPWFSLPKVMADGVRKVTGDLPGWKATDEQKSALEKMVNGVKDQDRPPEQELMEMSQGGPALNVGKGCTGQREADEGQKGLLQGAQPSMPYVPGLTSKSKTENKPAPSKVEQHTSAPSTQQAGQTGQRYGEFAGQGVKSTQGQKQQRPGNASRTQSQATSASNAPRRGSRIQQQGQSTPVGKQPGGSQKSGGAPAKKKPRKLEVRGNASGAMS
ncbi:uncharacterized protein LTR77_008246 [Saxophila tyrrhenica]|uniref:Uncharacterized protein n=1 Tax=Saxophila tyrrhenica TaxID=1690608 RepID=A0AAV9P329_9PEZI|nr:hypothetical protein LTR77_008246 [Saxophila tyrrhenica]